MSCYKIGQILILQFLEMFSFGFGSPLLGQPIGSLFDAFMTNPLQYRPPQEPNQHESFRKSRLIKTPNKSAPKEVYQPHQSMYWKQLGNEAYFGGRFKEALQLYDKAISIDPSNTKVLKDMGQFSEALRFAQEAIELDQSNYKGHLISGQILAELGKKQGPQKVERALVRLRKALTLYSCKKGEDKVGQINIFIFRAKKLIWLMQFQALKESRRKVAQQFRDYIQKDATLTDQQKQASLKNFLESNSNNCDFTIPDHLICQITYELMEDPVVTEAGLTYQRESIQEHIEKNGSTDPITRKPITSKLYPNIAIKKAVKEFVEAHPWAYEYVEGQTVDSVSFV